MKFKQPISLDKIISLTGAEALNRISRPATGINEIHKVEDGDITFVDHPKYYDKTIQSAATFILIDKKIEVPEDKCILFHSNPFEAYQIICNTYCPTEIHSSPISSTSSVDPTTKVESNVTIGNHVKIGPNCLIRAGAYIGDYTEIGGNCHIDANACIGTEAFYFHKESTGYEPWTTVGRVIIHDNVYVGPSCTIARGVSGDTIIGQGTKLDAQVQVGHGVVIGKNCLFAAQVGVGGKTIIGDNCTIYGQVGIAQKITIGDGAVVLGQSGVTKSIEGGKTYFGTPIMEARESFKAMAKIRSLSNK